MLAWPASCGVSAAVLATRGIWPKGQVGNGRSPADISASFASAFGREATIHAINLRGV
jgi:hypothetical protein